MLESVHNSSSAIIAFLGVPFHSPVARKIGDIVYGGDAAVDFVGVGFADWKPEPVIKLLRGMEKQRVGITLG